MNRWSYVGIITLFVFVVGACGSEEVLDSGQPIPNTPTVGINPVETQSGSDDLLQCDYSISDGIEQIDTIDQLAWYSQQIVIGTVTEKLASRKVPGGGPTPEVDYYIVTDYVIEVEERMRGSEDVAADKTVIVQAWGGTVNGCTQTWNGWPPFDVGDRALFFLRDFDDDDQSNAYDIFGRHQGYWEIDSAGFAAPNSAVHLLPNRLPIQIDQLSEQVRDSLADGPPDDPTYLRDWYLVSIDEAPIVSDTQELTP